MATMLSDPPIVTVEASEDAGRFEELPDDEEAVKTVAAGLAADGDESVAEEDEANVSEYDELGGEPIAAGSWPGKPLDAVCFSRLRKYSILTSAVRPL
jgi:hypothetical protein